MHLKDEQIQKLLDGELTPSEENKISVHLQSCARCRQHFEGQKEQQTVLQQAFDYLEPDPSRVLPGSQKTLSRLRIKREETKMKKIKISKPLVTVFVLSISLAVSLAFPSVRAYASQLLGLFRVDQISVHPLDTFKLGSIEENPTLIEAAGQLLAESVDILEGSPDEIFQVNSIQEAEAISGYALRLPGGEWAPEVIEVQSGLHFTFQVDLTEVQEIVDLGEIKDLQIPAELEGVKVDVTLPAIVSTSYGECWNVGDPDDGSKWKVGGECLILSESPSPQVSTSQDVDASKLVEIGLRLMGVSEEEASSFSLLSDWKTTLVLPIPRGELDVEEIKVDGTQGYWLVHQGWAEEGENELQTLVWVKDGLIYSLMFNSDLEKALELAASLQ